MSNTTIGIIGSGNIGRGLATHLAATSYPVLIANRHGRASLSELVSSIGGSLTAADLGAAIAQSDILFIAVPWTEVPNLARELEGHQGKIIVDATNNIVSVNPFRLADTGGKPTGAYVAGLLPGQRVVKAFNTLAAATLARPTQNNVGRTVIFLSGDDAEAKQAVATVTEAMSFTPVDIGTFQQGGHLQDIGGVLSSTEFINVTR